ncbi:MAG: 4Fe-4S dicluster domain-containing protein [Deltaproteobacteria bacterium]|nr:4Fe-4S dicluster domain-containing protein [Deltaproteobacteria bacterium]MBW1962642.1 4Fe-4S dicluster domain-containing protein [Deltaproteobacteria bacterium]MBW1993655.1 4Fe-4S dicluster domain-containing protein [Deltaproteobacteria bacterium]MBW2151409.1 4Fe-4S dicluster domain-containing protein [Deltaproteobacteria bacterium]
MIIYKPVCVGCGRCHPYCPAHAIYFEDMKSAVDQDLCYECGNCLRVEVCPVDAIAESPHVYEYPRAVRKYFSDPNATHAVTGIQGRGTEESKTNDVTLRCGPGEVGIGIEVGRPTLGMGLEDIQKITRALARNGITEIEKNNPIHSMIKDPKTGDLKPELLNEKVLSAIIEIQVKRDRLRDVLRTVKEVAREVDSVFTLDVYTMLEPKLTIPKKVLDIIESEGFSWRPNAKINMGLGRASDQD